MRWGASGARSRAVNGQGSGLGPLPASAVRLLLKSWALIQALYDVLNPHNLGRRPIHSQFIGQETGTGRTRDLSKITHPVKGRTKIQAVPAPGAHGGPHIRE